MQGSAYSTLMVPTNHSANTADTALAFSCYVFGCKRKSKEKNAQYIPQYCVVPAAKCFGR